MLRSFTRAELLREWLTRRGYQPLRSDVAADLTTGTDLAAHMGREVADWLRHIYATAPPQLLPVADGSTSARLTVVDSTSRRARMILPSESTRVLAVRLTGWSRAVALSPPGSEADLAADNPFLRPDSKRPLATSDPDGSILVCPAQEGATVELLTYVAPAPEYDADDEAEPIVFDPLLLASMADFNPSSANIHNPTPI